MNLKLHVVITDPIEIEVPLTVKIDEHSVRPVVEALLGIRKELAALNAEYRARVPRRVGSVAWRVGVPTQET